MSTPSRPVSDAAQRLERVLAALTELINWERRSRRGGMRQSLAPMQDLMLRLGSPERSFRAVHITGTKGKGSVTTLIGAGLRRAGLRVGVYTSPHVERVHERIAIDGQLVSDLQLSLALERALDARAQALAAATAAAEASWFDLMTAAAFLIFSEAGVAWAAVEVGLGGRLDSTNVIRGEVCVVTNIDLEHTSVLGGTRAQIAREKAGILKPGATLVTGVRPDATQGTSEDAGRVLQEAAGALGVELRSLPASSASWPSQRNHELAGLVLQVLGERGLKTNEGRPLDSSLLAQLGSEQIFLPGRLERLFFQGVPIVLDGAHVASSLELVLGELALQQSYRGPALGILSLGEDKDCTSFLKALRRATDTVACTYVAGSLHLPPAELCARARAAGFVAEACATPEGALHWALQQARGRWILATGSLYLAGALRPLIAEDKASVEG